MSSFLFAVRLKARVFARDAIAFSHRAEPVDILMGNLPLAAEQVCDQADFCVELKRFHAVVGGDEIAADCERSVIHQQQRVVLLQIGRDCHRTS